MSGRRILYVDDDAALCRLVQRDLRRHGYDAVLAGSGAEGERRAAEGGFDAICVDHYMPGQDGLETLERLHALPGLPPVIYVTGSEEGRVAVAALHAGAADYVIKEASAEFLPLLRRALDRAIERAALLRVKAAAEEEVRAARDRAEELARQREVLLREVNHRVANSLQLIVALTQVQEGTLTDAAARSALAEMRTRVMAVAQVHRRLYTSGEVGSVALDEYVRGLLEEIERSVNNDGRFRFEAELAPVRVLTDTAVSVGVIVAELVTNAIKYAYGDAGGPIRVRMGEADGEAVLVVEDDGAGLQEDGDPAADEAALRRAGSGTGRKIIDAIARSIRGRVERQERDLGTSLRLVFPLHAAG